MIIYFTCYIKTVTILSLLKDAQTNTNTYKQASYTPQHSSTLNVYSFFFKKRCILSLKTIYLQLSLS